MNILSALMKIDGIRISYEDKWLVWDNEWVVYQRKYRKNKTVVLCKTQIQDEAIKALCNED